MVKLKIRIIDTQGIESKSIHLTAKEAIQEAAEKNRIVAYYWKWKKEIVSIVETLYMRWQSPTLSCVKIVKWRLEDVL